MVYVLDDVLLSVTYLGEGYVVLIIVGLIFATVGVKVAFYRGSCVRLIVLGFFSSA